jgi:hypothetical protein
MRIRAPLFVAVSAVFAVAAAVAGPARAEIGSGWQSPDSIAGLAGSYSRPPLGRGPIAYVTLNVTHDYDGQRVDGTYTRFYDAGTGGLQLQTGSFGALPNNPAVGPFIFFNDDRGEFRDAFAIAGIKRDPLGKKIVALELVDARDGALFVLTRVGL